MSFWEKLFHRSPEIIVFMGIVLGGLYLLLA